MNILVLTGSPRKNGNSNQLADAFCAGAQDAGHKLFRYDTAALKIKPCLACEWCHDHGGRCITNDPMEDIYRHLLSADLIVLATPIYYFGMSAQLKAAIDRFFAVNDRISGKRAVLLSACEDTDEKTPQALQAHFSAICDYLSWEQAGCVIASGMRLAGEVAGTEQISKARALGRSLS